MYKAPKRPMSVTVADPKFNPKDKDFQDNLRWVINFFRTAKFKRIYHDASGGGDFFVIDGDMDVVGEIAPPLMYIELKPGEKKPASVIANHKNGKFLCGDERYAPLKLVPNILCDQVEIHIGLAPYNVIREVDAGRGIFSEFLRIVMGLQLKAELFCETDFMADEDRAWDEEHEGEEMSFMEEDEW